MGVGKGSAKRAGRPGLGVCGPRPPPRQGGDLREDRGAGGRRRVGTEHSALEPLTWRAGAREAELAAAAQGAAERGAQSAAPPPRRRRGDPARPRDPASAAPGMRRKGRGLFVSARRGRRSRPRPGQAPAARSPPSRRPPPSPLGLGGLSVPWGWARAGARGLLPSIGAARGGEGLGSRVSGSLRVSPGVPVSDAPAPRLCRPPRRPPLAGARFHGEFPGRGAIGRQRSRAGARPPRSRTPLRAAHPQPCTRRVRLQVGRSRALARPAAGQGAPPGGPGVRGRRVGPWRGLL